MTSLQLPPDDLERLAYDRRLPIELDTDGVGHVQVGSVHYWADLDGAADLAARGAIGVAL